MTSPDLRAPQVEPGEAAAACQAAVGVMTALRSGQAVPWSAIVDDPRQMPLVVCALATQLLVQLESDPVDVDEYLREWGAQAATQAANVALIAEDTQPAAAPPVDDAPVSMQVLAPDTPQQLLAAWTVMLDVLTSVRAGQPVDEVALLTGHNTRHLAFVAVNALHTLLGSIAPDLAQQALEGWGRAVNRGGEHG